MATQNAVGNGLSGASGTGSFAGTTSPTFVTPLLGTPTSGVLTNCTGLPTTGQTSSSSFVATSSGALTNVTGDGTSYFVPLNTAATNVGSNFNTGTGYYTAPVAGYYLFYTSLGMTGITGAVTDMLFGLYNGVAVTTTYLMRYSLSTTSGNITLGGSILLKLSANDTIIPSLYVAGITKTVSITAAGTAFNGYLLSV